jgi:hypothetical protein
VATEDTAIKQQNIAQILNKALRNVVYTFWFRRKRDGVGRGFAPTPQITIPIII